ncbi:extracellular solute-binding protein [Paenibacillus sp. CF384]|uniref:extracellular solute-binding protein n=1 Tax=Paenibacillus sp. CF384 TaxID=1884382 RepID=UPI00089C4F88|nr:extracellular solute-binding protein [Paenibacillus sp. CF384]SDX46401.1 putative aldouronate transport system substrate-binding protein [Paenibacillus sp. CF384]
MKARKMLSVILVSMLGSALLLSACSGNNSSNNGKSESGNATSTEGNGNDTKAVKEEPLTFSYFGNYDWWGLDSWGSDMISKWITDKKGVTVKEVATGGASQAKLNTMIASNELPDLILMDRGPGVERLRAAGALVPLDEYLDKYPNFKQYVGDATLNLLRSSDGKLYQLPNYYTSTPNGNSGWLIEKKIYKELGSPALDTFDDLHAYLKLVKDKYPNVIPLEIDTSGWGHRMIYTGFKENNPPMLVDHSVYVDGDALKPVWGDPAYAEALKYTSMLFREKLISQDALTQTGDQLSEKLINGRVAVIAAGDAANLGRSPDEELKKKDPEDGYMAIWPIHKAGLDKTKIMPNNWNSLGWNVNVITKNAKDPEAIFRFLDWMTSPEGQQVVWFGPQGVLWDSVDGDGIPIPNDKWTTMPPEEKDKIGLQSYNFVGNTTFIDGAKVKIEMALPEDKRNWSTVQQTNVFWKTSVNATQFVNLDPLPDTAEGIAAQSVGEIAKEALAKAIFAKNDAEVDEVLAQAEKDALKVGFDSVLKFKENAWHNNQTIVGQ